MYIYFEIVSNCDKYLIKLVHNFSIQSILDILKFRLSFLLKDRDFEEFL